MKQLSTTGGMGDRWSAELGELPGLDPALPVSTFDGADQARAAVRRMVRAGADWIKVTATGSVQGERAHQTQVTREELATIVDEAALRGCGVMVHAHEARAAAMAAEVGARSIEHGVWLDENAVATMAQHGTVLVPTLSVTQGRDGQVGSEVAAAHRVSFQLAVGAGVRIAMGTDNPGHATQWRAARNRAHGRGRPGRGGCVQSSDYERRKVVGFGRRSRRGQRRETG